MFSVILSLIGKLVSVTVKFEMVSVNVVASLLCVVCQGDWEVALC